MSAAPLPAWPTPHNHNKENIMTTLVFLTTCLLTVFVIDTRQKRQRFLDQGK
jgi:hypothetical protein